MDIKWSMEIVLIVETMFVAPLKHRLGFFSGSRDDNLFEKFEVLDFQWPEKFMLKT